MIYNFVTTFQTFVQSMIYDPPPFVAWHFYDPPPFRVHDFCDPPQLFIAPPWGCNYSYEGAEEQEEQGQHIQTYAWHY